MTMREMMDLPVEDLYKLQYEMDRRENYAASRGIGYVIKFANKRVRVFKGRKVPKGTEGTCFWLGSYCHSPYGDPWGIYTSFRCGIRMMRARSTGLPWTTSSSLRKRFL